MRIGIIGVLIAVVALGVAAITLAEKPETQPLAAVTVAVDGLHCQACVDELQTDLGKVPGVTELTITQQPGQVTAKLDESKISASTFVTLIATHPQAMDQKKTYGAKLVAYIDTEMCAKETKMCDACFTEIPKVLKAVKGVSKVTLDETGKIAAISFVKGADVSTSALAKALGQSDFKFQVAFSIAQPESLQLTAVTVAVDGLHCQACVDELQKDLGKAPGVTELTVTQKPGQVTAKLDESKISASTFVTMIATHPQAMDRKKTYGAKLVAYIDTEMCAKETKMCDACFTEIPKVLKAVKGVGEVTLDETGKIAAISFVKGADVSTSALAKALGQSDFKFQTAFSSAKPEACPPEHHAEGAASEGCDMETMKSAGDGCCD